MDHVVSPESFAQDSEALAPAFESLDNALERAAKVAAYQVADLIDNVIQGIESNQTANDPAEANHRLLATAVSLTQDVIRNTKVNGRNIFASHSAGGNSTIEVYERIATQSLASPPLVKRLSMALREVAQTMGSLSAGSNLETLRSIGYLNELGQRLRGSLVSQAKEEAHVLNIMV